MLPAFVAVNSNFPPGSTVPESKPAPSVAVTVCAIAPEFSEVIQRPGLLDRAIVIGGRTFGSWRRTLTARSVLVEASLFGQLTEPAAAALDEAVARFGRFLGLPASLEARVPANANAPG